MWGNAGTALNKFVGGWSLAAITWLSSGFPFTPTYLPSSCTEDIGSSAYRPCRPNLVGQVHITGSRSQYFTTTGGTALAASCAPTPNCPAQEHGFNTQTGDSLVGQTIGPWQRPGAGQIGDAGQNPLRGPGYFQADLAVSKQIAITERVGIRFRADAFNVFNKINLNNPTGPATAVDGPAAGQINFLAPGAIQRQMQFSLHIIF